MNIKSFYRSFLVLGFSLFLAGKALAQEHLDIQISGVGATQIPVTIAGFANETVAPQKVTDIIRADLARTGLFRLVGTDAILPESAFIDYPKWKANGADALVVGSVEKTADGKIDVRYRLFDLGKASQLSALSMVAPAPMTRVTAHKIADDIYEKLTGIKGMFATRIAYVVKAGNEYRLEIADSDGEGRQLALRSKEPIISPSWSPDGTKVAYVSFEAKKPVVYVQNLVTRARTVVANYKGNNSAPSWSPDGTKLAVALSKNGYTQIYTVNANGGSLRQLTQTRSINTEPQFSADGKWIYFTSDRSGGPQIYKIGVNGGNAQRVTFGSNYNISPRVSPDGKSLAYISRRNGGFQLYLMDLENGQEMRLSDTARDESPSFSPNGQFIMYATGSGRRGVLSVVSVDGRVRQRLTMKAADVREPSWGPFMK
ncbi:tol-Pal system beta propeller repeat protein TolB [Oxalobacter formigenes HOxBLS]|uniref:Tol-Pal system protein TolB n=1 Tax=Oxalobacter paraformigenes TaxID=556268 RepID=C3X4H1_9BURK|nr:tol-Pal system beta propeller repeat protein TolB [Oxalobacter paraformigenes]